MSIKENELALKLYPLHKVYSHLYLILRPVSEPGFSETSIVACDHFLLFHHDKYHDHALLYIKGVSAESAKRIFNRFVAHQAAQQPDANLFYRCAAAIIDAVGSLEPEKDEIKKK